MLIAVSAVDRWLASLVPRRCRAAAPRAAAGLVRRSLVLALAGARRRAQLLAGAEPVRAAAADERSFNPLHLVNTYGAFGSVTRERHEVVVEGTDDAELTADTAWREYEFKGKPGDPRRRPRSSRRTTCGSTG